MSLPASSKEQMINDLLKIQEQLSQHAAEEHALSQASRAAGVGAGGPEADGGLFL